MKVVARREFGATPLHRAASDGDECKVLECLHEYSPNEKDWESGWTPLHRSLYHGHLRLSFLLLRRGALLGHENEATVQDHEGHTPLDVLSLILRDNSRGDVGRGSVYTFGKADFQLGYHLPNADEQLVPRVVDIPEKIRNISASKYHSLAISCTGTVYSWGFGRGGRLGHGTECNHVKPTPIEYLKRKPIIQVSAGENHSLAITENGELFSWGANSYGQLGYSTTGTKRRLTPKKIELSKRVKIIDVAASVSHSMVIDEKGMLYGFGNNKHGQLGVKDGFGTDQPNYQPRIVKILKSKSQASEQFRAIRVDGAQSYTWAILKAISWDDNDAVNNSQEVYQWGHGSCIPSKVLFNRRYHVRHNIWYPSIKQRVDIVDISCAKNHAMALSSCGTVYTSGSDSDVIGHGVSRKQNTSSPQIVDGLLSCGKVISIAAGEHHCAVVTDTGDVFTWGSGCAGVLGHGKTTYLPSPKQVRTVKRAEKIAIGFNHTMVLIAPRQPSLPDINVSNTHVPETYNCKSKPSNTYEAEESKSNEAPSLWTLCQKSLCSAADLHNVLLLLQYAEALNATHLLSYCMEYLRLNLDAVLVMNRDRDWNALEDLVPVENTQSTRRLVESTDIEETKQPAMDFIEQAASYCKLFRSLRKRVQDCLRLQEKHRIGEVLEREQQEKLDCLSMWREELGITRAKLNELLPYLNNQLKQKAETLLQLPQPTSNTPTRSRKHKKQIAVDIKKADIAVASAAPAVENKSRKSGKQRKLKFKKLETEVASKKQETCPWHIDQNESSLPITLSPWVDIPSDTPKSRPKTDNTGYQVSLEAFLQQKKRAAKKKNGTPKGWNTPSAPVSTPLTVIQKDQAKLQQPKRVTQSKGSAWGRNPNIEQVVPQLKEIQLDQEIDQIISKHSTNHVSHNRTSAA